MESGKMFSLKDVTFAYKRSSRGVLRGVSAEFERGKFYAVVGSSGSGKTTLLSLMAGLDEPHSGEIYIDGKNITSLNLNEYRRCRVSVVFQAFQLFPLLTALENVCYPMETNGMAIKNAAAKAKELLVSVGIDESKHNRYPANLSGGEQQRVAIARALGTGADIILADEPTGNLDTENGDAVIAILRSLAHQQNYCVIIVTHNTAIAEAADKTYKMLDGVLL
jgi:putative ABC transport system ATP-binding protein